MNLKIIKRKKLNEHETVYDIFVQFLAPSRKKKSNLESSRLLNRSLQKYEWLFAKARSRSQPLNRARIWRQMFFVAISQQLFFRDSSKHIEPQNQKTFPTTSCFIRTADLCVS